MHQNKQHFCSLLKGRLSLIAVALGSAVLLQGCVLAPIVVGGAAIGTASVMTDRRSAGTIVNDQVLESRVVYEINRVLGEKNHHITATSYEGKVLLTGEVKT